jgi:hypothetical protein
LNVLQATSEYGSAVVETENRIECTIADAKTPRYGRVYFQDFNFFITDSLKDRPPGMDLDPNAVII